MAKKIFTISGMHCTACSLVIEGELEDIGVIARADYAKQIVTIDHRPENISDDLIKSVIEKQGYTVVG